MTYTESEVRDLMLHAADEWDRMPLRWSHERLNMTELVDSLLAEHKARHASRSEVTGEERTRESRT